MSRSIANEKPVVVVTGCASGLGLELAKALYLDEGFRVAITARRHHMPRLHQIFEPNSRCRIFVLDITDDENIYRVVHEVCREWGRVDIVVNNAAVCYRGVVEHMDSEAEMVQLKTNYLGPMSLIRAVLPIMREQRSGQIINVSSASGVLAMPTMGSYSASKHALEGATEALWYEAKPFGICVNLIEMGFVNSQSYRKVVLSRKAEISAAIDGPHAEFYSSITPFIERLMRISPVSAEKVAGNILRIMRARPTRLRLAATPDAILFAFLRKAIPSGIFNWLAFKILPGSRSWGGAWKAESLVRPFRTG